MKIRIGILSFLLVMVTYCEAYSFSNETLKYVISYKWGLIHKDAGEAKMSLTSSGDTYKLKLTGMTKPWADSFYKVRDTLYSTVRKSDISPISYSKIAHENGKYSRDDIKFSYSGNNVSGSVKKIRQNKKGESKKTDISLSGSGKVFDMLSVFYYLRTLNYESMKNGEKMVYTIFSGSKSEKLTVRFKGTETIKLKDNSKSPAYHIVFNFTTEGKKKSSDDIDAWISTDKQHIPLLVEGSLPVGKVKCYYVK